MEIIKVYYRTKAGEKSEPEENQNHGAGHTA